MRRNVCFTLLTVLFYFMLFNLAAQQQYFPYDDLPGLVKSYKPAYNDELPEWAKMMYQPELNFLSVDKAYEDYMEQHPGEKSPTIRYYKNWRRAVASFVQDDGTIILPDMTQYYRNLQESQIKTGGRVKQPLVTSDWTFLGPKQTFWLNEQGSPVTPSSCPWQVNVYSFDVAGSDPEILYCGTETGFVNKTTDKGLTWQLLADDYNFGGSVTAVAVHPQNPDIVYVAAGNQLHKTPDGGQTWMPLLETGDLFYADRLRIVPSNPEKILAAAATGVYVSDNGGLEWIRKWNAPAYDVEVNPYNQDVIFALTKANGNFSVIISEDGGETFQVMNSFPSSYAEVSGGLLAVTPADPNLLFAVLLSSNNTPYMLKGISFSGIWNWSLLATGNTSYLPMNNGQGYFDLVLDVSPVNPNVIFAGTTTLYKSLNGGANFTAVGGYSGGFSIHPDIQDIRMLSNGETWVSTDGGMNLTTDNFQSQANYFVRVNGLMGSDMWGFDQGWNEDIVVGGRYHNGNTAMTDFYGDKALRMGGAESPTGWVLHGKSRHVAFNDLGNGWILPQTAEGEPEGRFIFSKYPNMDEYGGRRGNLVQHPNYYGTLYLGEGNGYWKSTDCGVTWELLHNFNGRVRYLQISYSNPDVLYVDVVSYGLYKSTDGGVNWTQQPTLTSPPNGNSNWKGKLFFAISPYDENVVYACMQNGTWSADIGKVFRSADGGDTWLDWTGNLQEYMKCMVVQPTNEGVDLVYLFTNATNGKPAKVYCRKYGMTEWNNFDLNYPAGMHVNLALPFYRDGKLRVGGTGSVWESAMAEPQFTPIINPWVEKAYYNCMTDTLYFDDHSMLNHSGTSWHWEISPQPSYISNPDIRNPKVVPGSPGNYTITLTVTKNGQSYSKTVPDMVTTTTCPSIDNCSNPAVLPKEEWSLLYVDSQEINYPGRAIMSFDGDPETIWHTRWSTGSDPYPHEIRVDLGNMYRVFSFTYLNRQDGENGRIKEYELYITSDTLNWGLPVKTGEFENTAAPQTIGFEEVVVGQYFRLVALSEINGNPWASAAEFSIVGCTDITYGFESSPETMPQQAFPVPSDGRVNVSAPDGRHVKYLVYTGSGRTVQQGELMTDSAGFLLDLTGEAPGIYLVRFTDEIGTVYFAKVLLKR